MRRNLVAALIVSALIALAFVARALTPTTLPPIFDGLFFSSALLFIASSVTLGHLYYSRGASTRPALFLFSLLLILASSLMYSSMQDFSDAAATWKPYLLQKHPWLYAFLPVFIDQAKNIISFGFAAIGASLAAAAITEKGMIASR